MLEEENALSVANEVANEGGEKCTTDEDLESFELAWSALATAAAFLSLSNLADGYQ